MQKDCCQQALQEAEPERVALSWRAAVPDLSLLPGVCYPHKECPPPLPPLLPPLLHPLVAPFSPPKHPLPPVQP